MHADKPPPIPDPVHTTMPRLYIAWVAMIPLNYDNKETKE